MRDEKQVLYTVSWTQTYDSWPKQEITPEPEIADLTQAQEVLARIMAL